MSNLEIIQAIEARIITEICIGDVSRLDKDALMINKALIYAHKDQSTALGILLYPFQKFHLTTPYLNLLQLQLYPKNHMLWNLRKSFDLDDFEEICNLSKRFPNNYYLCQYLYEIYLKRFQIKKLRGGELETLTTACRQDMDHSTLWCWLRCLKLHFPEKKAFFLATINKMATVQWNSALENIILSAFNEFKFKELESYLGNLNTRRTTN
eukprot:NODE_32_length_37098_cov_1.132760.p17 type:complete len:210 gc:universal NODE_32_length_37098_cov_1.132760:25769-25140(-)